MIGSSGKTRNKEKRITQHHNIAISFAESLGKNMQQKTRQVTMKYCDNNIYNIRSGNYLFAAISSSL